jgi:hypothetical protein
MQELVKLYTELLHEIRRRLRRLRGLARNNQPPAASAVQSTPSQRLVIDGGQLDTDHQPPDQPPDSDGTDTGSTESLSPPAVVPERVGPPVHTIDGIDELIARIEDCETIRDWSFLLNDYIQWGNNTTVSKHAGIFNLGATHDCVNRWTDRCQVDGDECYAGQDPTSRSLRNDTASRAS